MADDTDDDKLFDFLSVALELVPLPEVIAKWREIQAQLADIKELESAYREIVVARTFDELNPGTNRRPVTDDEDLRVIVNEKIELMPITTLGPVLDQIRHKYGQDAVDKFIYWEPKLNKDAYKAEKDQGLLTMLRQAVLTTYGKPQAAIVKAKASE